MVKREAALGPSLIAPVIPHHHFGVMAFGSSTVTLGLLALPTELLIHVLLAIEEPWAIHHSAKIFFAISEVSLVSSVEAFANPILLLRTSIICFYGIHLSLLR